VKKNSWNAPGVFDCSKIPFSDMSVAELKRGFSAVSRPFCSGNDGEVISLNFNLNMS